MEDKKRKRKPNAWIQTLQINEYYCGAINPSEIFYHYGYIGGWWGMQTFSGWYFQKRKQFYFVELWLTFFHFRIINSKQSFTSLYFYFLFSRLGHFCYWNDWARKQFYRHEVVLKSSRLTHFTKCNQITKHQMSTFLLFPPPTTCQMSIYFFLTTWNICRIGLPITRKAQPLPMDIDSNAGGTKIKPWLSFHSTPYINYVLYCH